VKGDRPVANGKRRSEATLHRLLALWRGNLQKATPWRQKARGKKSEKGVAFCIFLKIGDQFWVLIVKR